MDGRDTSYDSDIFRIRESVHSDRRLTMREMASIDRL